MQKDVYCDKACGEDVPDVIIHIDRTVPDFQKVTQQDKAFDIQANMLEDALLQSLPGGLYDRLLGKMLERKATHFRVSHTV